MIDRSVATFRRALLCGGALVACSSQAAWAQDVPAGTAAPSASVPTPPGGDGVQPAAGPASVEPNEIIVTAQRRAERLENVPMSITAVSPATLEKTGVTGLQEIGRIAPGVQLNFAGAFTQPAIRGVTTLTNGAGSDNNVAVYVDGFYVPDSLSINGDLVNVSDIQILKGPQGTLYGRNATGGAILINTLAPSKQWTGRVDGEVGRFANTAVKGYVSGPISDSLRFSLAGSIRHSDGYLRLVDPRVIGGKVGDAAPLRKDTFQAKLQDDITDKLTATVAFNYGLSSDPRGNLYTPRQYIPFTGPFAEPRPPRLAVGLFNVSYNYPSHVAAQTFEPTLTLAWDTGLGTLTSRTGYGIRKFKVDFDFDGSYADKGYSFGRSKTKDFQESVDYAITAIDHVDLVIGGLYYRDHFGPDIPGTDYQTITYGVNHVYSTGSTVGLRTRSYAVFADATIHFTDHLALDVGARYSHDRKLVDEFVATLNPTTAALTGYSFAPTHRDAKFHKITPRASLRYEIAPRTNVYASFSEGYRSGSFNANPVSAPNLLLPVRPETIKAYEVGVKTAQSKLRAEIAGFVYQYHNYNVAINAVNPLTNSVTTIVGNAPTAHIRGVDGQVTYAPFDRTNLTVGAAYVHARYGDFRNATGTGLNAATGFNVGGQQQDWTGQQMSRAPNFTANVSLDHTFDFMGGSLLTAGNVNYTDSYVISNPSLYGPLAPAGLQNKQRFRQPHYALLNLQGTWTDASGHLTLGVFGKNLTNHRYRASYNGTALYGDYSVYAEPVTWGVRAGYKF